MPLPDPNCASVVVACTGPGQGETRSAPIGVRRSRDGAQLELVLADAEYWHGASKKAGGSGFHALLVNPTRNECLTAIVEAGAAMDAVRAGGGQLQFVFSGHGARDGSLVLIDGNLSPDELVAAIASTADRTARPRRQLTMLLDCCYSARTLAHLVAEHGRSFFMLDGYAAALSNESAWEIDTLGHGALTFTLKNPGNAHVDQTKLSRAVEEGDDAYLRFALQAFVPNSATYLTEGDQHSVHAVNGHTISIEGRGGVEIISSPPRLEDLFDAFESACESETTLHV